MVLWWVLRLGFLHVELQNLGHKKLINFYLFMQTYVDIFVRICFPEGPYLEVFSQISLKQGHNKSVIYLSCFVIEMVKKVHLL